VTKVWGWFKKWGLLILGILLLLVGIGWVWQRARLGKVRDRLAAEQALRKVHTLRATRAMLKGRVREEDEAIEAIHRQLDENKKKYIEAHEVGEGKSDEEMLAEFARLGI